MERSMIVYPPRAALARLVLPTFAAGSDVSVVIKQMQFVLCFIVKRYFLSGNNTVGSGNANWIRLFGTESYCTVPHCSVEWVINVHTWLTAALLGICRFRAGLFWTGRLSGLIPLNRAAFFLAAKPVMTPCPGRLATVGGSLRFRVKRLFTAPPTDGQNKTSGKKFSDMADLHTFKHWN